MIETNLYNKTDCFTFKANRFPYFNSEVSIKIGRNIIYTETLIMANACSKVEYFYDKIKEFHKIPVNNGFNREFIVNNINRCILRNRQILFKYSVLDNRSESMNFVKILNRI